MGSSVLTATAPWGFALPLVERPRHVVLVVLGGVPGVDPDQLAPPGVVGGGVPRALRELVRAVVGPRTVVRLVVAAALDATGADHPRVVVLGMLAGARGGGGGRPRGGIRGGGRRGRGRGRGGDTAPLVLRRAELGIEPLLVVLEA